MALRELRITNVAVVAEASLRTESGFIALTGETGAGKSVCIGALRTVLGGRADAEMIRHGADAAVIAAVFDEVPGPVRARLDALGAPDEDLVTLTRHIPRSGRGSCRINGALVSQSALREISEQLVEVTSQGASQRLLRRDVQRDMLDAAAGEIARAARNVLERAMREWRTATRRLDSARRGAASSEAELRVARDTVAELLPLQLRAAEEQELVVERMRLRHAAAIVAAAAGLAEASGADETGAADMVARSAAPAAELASVDPGMAGLAAAAADLVERLRDLQLEARRRAESCVVDDGRLAAVEERLEIIGRTKRRYGSLDAALAALGKARNSVDAFDAGAEALTGEEAAVESSRQSAGAAAQSLSAIRKDAARQLERAVTQELRRLALPHARFRVTFSVAPDADGVDIEGERLRCAAHGVDEVEFRLATNKDVLPMPLDEGPSGGELSRLALAVAAVVNDHEAPALVLDEVDTGIGGETAAAVGDALARIGRSRQVLAVTHRAEIGARADEHLCVVKRQQIGGAEADVHELSGEDRLQEIARLLSGRATEAALRRAAELLREGAVQGGVPQPVAAGRARR